MNSVRRSMVNPVHIVAEAFTPEESESVITRIREVAAEIMDDRDKELVQVVAMALLPYYSPGRGAARDTIAAIRAAGYTITKDRS